MGHLLRVGAHVSSEGGLANVLAVVEEKGMGAAQIFVGSPRSYDVNSYSEEDVKEFKLRTRDKQILVHTPYIINMCEPVTSQLGRLTLRVLKKTYVLADRLGAFAVVSHVGSSKEMEEREVLINAAKCLKSVLNHVPKTSTLFLLENDAGGGTKVAKLSRIRKITKAVRAPKRTGICFDTAHAFANGVDLREEKVLKAVKGNFLSSIKAVHLNEPDINVVCGKHLDRHATKIGEGSLGLKPIARIISGFKDKPLICECMDEEVRDWNIKFVRRLVMRLMLKSKMKISPLEFIREAFGSKEELVDAIVSNIDTQTQKEFAKFYLLKKSNSELIDQVKMMEIY